MALPPTRLHLESKDKPVPGGQQGFSPPREMQAEATDFMQGVLQRFPVSGMYCILGTEAVGLMVTSVSILSSVTTRR